MLTSFQQDTERSRSPDICPTMMVRKKGQIEDQKMGKFECRNSPSLRAQPWLPIQFQCCHTISNLLLAYFRLDWSYSGREHNHLNKFTCSECESRFGFCSAYLLLNYNVVLANAKAWLLLLFLRKPNSFSASSPASKLSSWRIFGW